MPENQYNNKKVTIMGLGRFGGGVGAVIFFAERGARVTVTDLKDEHHLSASVEKIRDYRLELHLGGHIEDDFQSAHIVCVSPAVKPGNEYVEAATRAGAKIVSEMELFFELFPGKIIGVTGSNGKSTVTQLMFEMLRKKGNVHVGGNIGRSLLPDIGSFTVHDTAVLELSSFQLHRLASVKRSPETAVITNITPNHLDWHKDYHDYLDSKMIIAKYQGTGDTVIYDQEDEGFLRVLQTGQGAKIPFRGGDTGSGIYLENGSAVLTHNKENVNLFSINEVRILGRFNLKNCAMAAAAAYLNGAEVEDIRETLAQFKGLAHRLQFVCEINGVRFYNDSVSTTPESTSAAAGSFPGNSVFILGGYDKGIDLKPAVEAVVAHCSGGVFMGKTGRKMAETALQLVREDFQVKQVRSMEEAVETAFEIVCSKGEGNVILSPACASYDTFENFEERGNIFMQCVCQLKERKENGS